MGKHGMTDQLARRLCRELYEFTDGCPMEWRQAVGGPSLSMILEHAVQHRWLIVDDSDSSMCCLTEEGRRLVRKTLS
jgi:hypothetical protein